MPEVVLLIASSIFGFILCELLFRAYLQYEGHKNDGKIELTVFDIGTEQYQRLVEEGLINESNHLFIPSEDKNLRFMMNPNKVKSVDGIRYSINKYGLRDKNRKIAKRENTFRILVLGDSIAVGVKINASDRFSNLLEQALNQKNTTTRFEVINAAVPGYNTRQEVEILKNKGLAYRPDIVLLAYFLNDPAISDGEFDSYSDIIKYCDEVYHPAPDENAGRLRRAYSGYEGLLNKSLLISFLARKYIFDDMLGEWRLFQPYEMNWHMSGAYKEYVCLHYDDKFWIPFTKELYRLKSLSEANNFTVIFMVLPKVDKFNDLSWRDYPYMPLHKKALTEARKNDFHTHDLIEDMRIFPSILIAVNDPQDSVHYSTFGHRVAALSIYNYLIENELIPEHGKFDKIPLTYASNSTLMEPG